MSQAIVLAYSLNFSTSSFRLCKKKQTMESRAMFTNYVEVLAIPNLFDLVNLVVYS